MLKRNLKKKINNFLSTKIEWLPLNSVKISKERYDDIIEFFESLEEDDEGLEAAHALAEDSTKNLLDSVIGERQRSPSS